MSRLPDMEAMAIFARIVETRGITAAAADLGLSVPTVSKALTRLEHRLGARLFNRTSRRLVLTEAGHHLAERATRLLADAEAAEAALRDDAVEPQGTVRLGAPMSYGVGQVAPLLPAFLARYPRISVDLDLSDAPVDLIAAGFDALLRIGTLANSSLMARRLAAVPRVVVAAPSYLRRRGRPLHPADLLDHDCFGYAYQGQASWRFRNAAGEEVAVTPSGPLTVNNGEAMLPALLRRPWDRHGAAVHCQPGREGRAVGTGPGRLAITRRRAASSDRARPPPARSDPRAGSVPDGALIGQDWAKVTGIQYMDTLLQ